MPPWQDKVVLITGGSAGLGFAIAEAFAQAGARVAIAARGREALDQAVEHLTRRGAVAVGFAADVTVDADVDTLIGAVIERYGRLDVLVNNAGVSARGEILATTPEDFQRLWELNFLGVVRCVRSAAPHLEKSGGQIINIGSLAAKSAARYLGAYPASKFAAAAYTQQLRLELGPRGIHAMLVCPGPIARAEGTPRYAEQSQGLPASASRPGGGVRTKAIDPAWLARRIVRGCERREAEIVVPGKARLLFAISQLSARWGDWLVKKMT